MLESLRLNNTFSMDKLVEPMPGPNKSSAFGHHVEVVKVVEVDIRPAMSNGPFTTRKRACKESSSADKPSFSGQNAGDYKDTPVAKRQSLEDHLIDFIDIFFDKEACGEKSEAKAVEAVEFFIKMASTAFIKAVDKYVCEQELVTKDDTKKVIKLLFKKLDRYKTSLQQVFEKHMEQRAKEEKTNKLHDFLTKIMQIPEENMPDDIIVWKKKIFVVFLLLRCYSTVDDITLLDT